MGPARLPQARMERSDIRERPRRLKETGGPAVPGWERSLPSGLHSNIQLQREYVHHRARIGVFERRRLGAGPVGAGGDGDVLLAVDRVADGRRAEAATGVEAPQLLQRLAVIGDERTLPQAVEDEIAAGREHASPLRQVGARHGFGLARHRIERLDAAGRLRAVLAAAAGEAIAPLVGSALVLEVRLCRAVDLAASLGRG